MSTNRVGGVTFAVKEGFYAVTDVAAWMGASIAFVHDAVINGEISSIRGANGVPLIPFNFVELIIQGGDENGNLD